MKRSIQEQIDVLRNCIEWGLQNHPEVPIICRGAADTMEAMFKENKRLTDRLLDCTIERNEAWATLRKIAKEQRHE